MLAEPYEIAGDEDHYETYDWEPSGDRFVELYESMLESDWVNEPLRELLEARVEGAQ